MLSVSDTGCGIPKEHLDRVFEPFFTTKATTAPGEADHAGLGLCTVHGIVQKMGGCIEVASGPGNLIEAFFCRFRTASGPAIRKTA